jgi:phosphoserine phosphatase
MPYQLTLLALTHEPLEQAQTAVASCLADVSPLPWQGLPPLSAQGVTTVLACQTACTLTPEQAQALKPRLLQAVAQLPVDVALLSPQQQRCPALALSDMDSTLLNAECIDELADVLHLKPQVAAITERAMQGELDFAQALRQRVALLKGLNAEGAVAQLWPARLPLMAGAQALMQGLGQRGVYRAVVSGGFTLFTQLVANALGLEAHVANILALDEAGCLTGELLPPLIDAQAKVTTLHRLAAQQGITLGQCLTLGDGANDVPMLQASGVSVAVKGKAVAQQAATLALNHTPLNALLLLWP